MVHLTGAGLQVKPLSQDLLGWSDDRMHALRAAMVLALGILQFGAARPLVQVFHPAAPSNGNIITIK